MGRSAMDIRVAWKKVVFMKLESNFHSGEPFQQRYSDE